MSDTDEENKDNLDAVNELGALLKQAREPGPFLVDLVHAFDLISFATWTLYVAMVYSQLGLEAALLLGVFYLVRGVAHFWSLRLCKVPFKKMRFMLFFGGFMELLLDYFKRADECICSLAPSVWVLISSLAAFAGYLVTGNLTCLTYAWLSFAIQAAAIVPLVPDLDGADVVKSITFSLSKKLGFAYMALNTVLLPMILAVLAYLRDGGQADYIGLIPLLVAGVQQFSQEYYRKLPIQPMTMTEVKQLGGVYLFVLACFLALPKVLGISSVSAASLPLLWPTIVAGVLGLVFMPILRNNIIAALEFKRGLCGE